MARIEFSQAVSEELDKLIETRFLPEDTRARVVAAVRHLTAFPEAGAPLDEARGLRFVLGPWHWMLIVYRWRLELDLVEVVAIEDSRAADAATSGR